MQAGAYFVKPKLLSDEINTLINDIQNAESVSGSIPSSLYQPQPQPYQQYFRLACPINKTYQKFYQNQSQPSMPYKSNNQNQPKNKVSNYKQKKEQKKNGNKKAKPQPQVTDVPSIGRCKFVVGRVVDISDHPNADAMYVETIDVGEEEPRQIVSGIKGKVSKEEMKGSLVIVFVNLKKAKLRGTDSFGMILAASNADKSKLEIVRPPKGSKIGEQVILEDDDLTQYNETRIVNSKKKNNPWLDIKDDLKTDANGIACYQGRKFITSEGPLSVISLSNANIS